jgi:hypothetical protein
VPSKKVAPIAFPNKKAKRIPNSFPQPEKIPNSLKNPQFLSPTEKDPQFCSPTGKNPQFISQPERIPNSFPQPEKIPNSFSNRKESPIPFSNRKKSPIPFSQEMTEEKLNLAAAGEVSLNVDNFTTEQRGEYFKENEENWEEVRIPFSVIFLLFIPFWGLMALFYRHAEGWAWLDCFYFTFVSFTAIGKQFVYNLWRLI